MTREVRRGTSKESPRDTDTAKQARINQVQTLYIRGTAAGVQVRGPANWGCAAVLVPSSLATSHSGIWAMLTTGRERVRRDISC